MAQATSPALVCPTPDLHPGAQGIVRIAVNDARAELVVTFARPLTLPRQDYLLSPRSYSLTGGRRLFPRVRSAALYGAASPPAGQTTQVLLQLDGLGDFSIYTLTVSGPDIDPFFASHQLRF